MDFESRRYLDGGPGRFKVSSSASTISGSQSRQATKVPVNLLNRHTRRILEKPDGWETGSAHSNVQDVPGRYTKMNGELPPESLLLKTPYFDNTSGGTKVLGRGKDAITEHYRSLLFSAGSPRDGQAGQSDTSAGYSSPQTAMLQTISSSAELDRFSRANQDLQKPKKANPLLSKYKASIVPKGMKRPPHSYSETFHDPVFFSSTFAPPIGPSHNDGLAVLQQMGHSTMAPPPPPPPPPSSQPMQMQNEQHHAYQYQPQTQQQYREQPSQQQQQNHTRGPRVNSSNMEAAPYFQFAPNISGSGLRDGLPPSLYENELASSNVESGTRKRTPSDGTVSKEENPAESTDGVDSEPRSERSGEHGMRRLSEDQNVEDEEDDGGNSGSEEEKDDSDENESFSGFQREDIDTNEVDDENEIVFSSENAKADDTIENYDNEDEEAEEENLAEEDVEVDVEVDHLEEERDDENDEEGSVGEDESGAGSSRADVHATKYVQIISQLTEELEKSQTRVNELEGWLEEERIELEMELKNREMGNLELKGRSVALQRQLMHLTAERQSNLEHAEELEERNKDLERELQRMVDIASVLQTKMQLLEAKVRRADEQKRIRDAQQAHMPSLQTPRTMDEALDQISELRDLNRALRENLLQKSSG